jgi:hypothetical protein
VIPRRAPLILLLAVVLAGLAMPGPAAAQRVRFEGRLLWISGNTMAVAANDGPSVSIDLSNVPQSDYQGLEEGEWIMVLAEYSRDRRNLLGLSVTRYSGFQAP